VRGQANNDPLACHHSLCMHAHVSRCRAGDTSVVAFASTDKKIAWSSGTKSETAALQTEL
jgi:hypothetical protein